MSETAGKRLPSSNKKDPQHSSTSKKGRKLQETRKDRKERARALAREAARPGAEIKHARSLIQDVIDKNNAEFVELRIRREWLDLSQTLELFALRSHRLSAVYHRLLEDFAGDTKQFMHAQEISLDVKKEEIRKHIAEIGSEQYREGADELRRLLEKLALQISTVRDSCKPKRKRSRQESIKVVVMQVVRVKEITKFIPNPRALLRRKSMNISGQVPTEEPAEISPEPTRPPTVIVPDVPKTPAYRKKAAKELRKTMVRISSSDVVTKWENFIEKADTIRIVVDKQSNERKLLSGVDKIADQAKTLSDLLAVYMKTLQDSGSTTAKGTN